MRLLHIKEIRQISKTGVCALKGSSWYSPKTVVKVGISCRPKKGGGDFAGEKPARNEDTAGILSIVDHDTRDSNVCRVFAGRLCPNFSKTQKFKAHIDVLYINYLWITKRALRLFRRREGPLRKDLSTSLSHECGECRQTPLLL